MQKLHNALENILQQYQSSFEGKVYIEENNDHDILMDVFNITPNLKRENRQYWGRELGMCWQLLIQKIAELNCIVVGEILPNVITNFEQKLGYLRDIETRDILPYAVSTTTGKNTLPSTMV